MNAVVTTTQEPPDTVNSPDPPPQSPEHQMLAWLLNLVDPEWPDHYRVTIMIDQDFGRLSPTLGAIRAIVDNPSEQKRFKALLTQMVKDIPHNELSHKLAELRKATKEVKDGSS